MRIAIPIWEEKISPVLDTAGRLLIIDADQQQEVGRFETMLEEAALSRRCSRIKALSIDILICGAVSRQFLNMLKAFEVDVIPGISGSVREVLKAYWCGNLVCDKFLMPGYKEHRFS